MIESIAFLLISTSIQAFPAESLKRPLLTIPQGQIESRLNPKAKGKAGERGAWQVLQREWGKVPRGLKAQAKQHEQIMDALIKENHGNISKAVMRYNSYKNIKAGYRYLAKVRKRAIEYYFIA